MSKKWTGKGSKSRVRDKRKYDENYDKIFKKEIKDIHGNVYDPTKMSDEQHDFSEVPYEESDFCNYSGLPSVNSYKEKKPHA